MSDVTDGFDLDNPDLPKAIKKAALTSGGFPYDEKLDSDAYEAQLKSLHLELAKLQEHFVEHGDRMVLVFEGRDSAGKGGAIRIYTQNVNPRVNIVAALPKPSDREATQWYFQRYADWLPARGETVLFDRSWYNRAGVEKVMGYCTPEQAERFLEEAPQFEATMVHDGIHLFKFYLDIGKAMQAKRFHDRQHDPLKSWKIGPVDRKALDRWDAYSEARNTMLAATDTDQAPWTVILANDKSRARLAVLRTVLSGIDYAGKDKSAIGAVDERIVYSGRAYLERKD